MSKKPRLPLHDESCGTQGVRWEKVRAIKALLAAGKYETEKKLEVAIERLCQELNERDNPRDL